VKNTTQRIRGEEYYTKNKGKNVAQRIRGEENCTKNMRENTAQKEGEEHCTKRSSIICIPRKTLLDR